MYDDDVRDTFLLLQKKLWIWVFEFYESKNE
jgi:hypothetical protein